MPKTDKARPNSFYNNALPTVYIDGFEVHSRQDAKYLLRIMSRLPEGDFEQGRFMVDKVKLEKLVNSLCEILDYYPQKAADKEQREK